MKNYFNILTQGRKFKLISVFVKSTDIFWLNIIWLLLPALFIQCTDKSISIADGTGPYGMTYSQSGGQGQSLIDIDLVSEYGTKAASEMIESLDIFYYNDDELRHLDSYQHLSAQDIGARIITASRSGSKILAVIANGQKAGLTWSDYRSYAALSNKIVNLCHEDPRHPLLYGICNVTAGTEKRKTVTMIPLTAKVSVGSMSCDFHNRPYNGAELENVRIYLTNVYSSTSILDIMPSDQDTEDHPIISIVNHGYLSNSDLDTFDYPEILYRSLDAPLGSKVIFPGIEFLCYRPADEEESIGTPHTKLVIEGFLEGRKYYYPIDLCKAAKESDTTSYPGTDHEGQMAGGSNYILNITITGRGTDNPDQSLQRGIAEIQLRIAPWEERNRQNIKF